MNSIEDVIELLKRLKHLINGGGAEWTIIDIEDAIDFLKRVR